MLTVARVELPAAVQNRLEAEASFSEAFSEFAKERLIGFQRPLAATIALVGPVLIAFTFHVAGALSALQIGAGFSVAAAIVLGIAAYINWDGIKSDYAKRRDSRRRAVSDLRAGFGEANALPLTQAPRFYEHEYGVIALAAAGPWKTLYFDIPAFEEDPRWYLYLNGDMHRRYWTWLRLASSGDIASFEACGDRLARIGETPFINAPEAWEAVQQALGEPVDGALLPYSFNDTVQMVERAI